MESGKRLLHLACFPEYRNQKSKQQQQEAQQQQFLHTNNHNCHVYSQQGDNVSHRIITHILRSSF